MDKVKQLNKQTMNNLRRVLPNLVLSSLIFYIFIFTDLNLYWKIGLILFAVTLYDAYKKVGFKAWLTDMVTIICTLGLFILLIRITASFFGALVGLFLAFFIYAIYRIYRNRKAVLKTFDTAYDVLRGEEDE